MSRMLAAQLYRLRHDKVFWGGLICMVFYALAVLGLRSTVRSVRVIRWRWISLFSMAMD